MKKQKQSDQSVTSNDNKALVPQEIKQLSKIAKIDNNRLLSSFMEFSKGWTTLDIDLWQILGTQVVDKKDQLLKIPVERTKDLIQRNRRRHESLNAFIDRCNQSLTKFLKITLSFKNDEGSRLQIFTTHLFDSSYIDSDAYLYLRVSKPALPVFNNLTRWTRFSLEDFTTLRSVYSKRLFIFLKQWRTVGKVTFDADEFREKMTVPKSYRTGSVDQKVVDVALEELAPFFKQLHVTKRYAKGKRGRKLASYTFSFVPERRKQKDIIQNQSLNDTERIYNIMSNRYLSLDHRLRAVDRYRGVRLGTTKRLYESAHPNSYFLDPNDKGIKSGKINKSGFHRQDLSSAGKMTLTELKRLVSTYEIALRGGKLKQWDIADLALLEEKLFVKMMTLTEKTRGTSQPYKSPTRLIADNVWEQLKDAPDYKEHAYKQEIQRLIHEKFGAFAQEEDNRPLEIRGLFGEPLD